MAGRRKAVKSEKKKAGPRKQGRRRAGKLRKSGGGKKEKRRKARSGRWSERVVLSRKSGGSGGKEANGLGEGFGVSEQGSSGAMEAGREGEGPPALPVPIATFII